MITTITLNPALDTTLYVKNLVADDSNRVIKVQKDPGGKGLNVSRILKKLGIRVTTIAIFGGHTGSEVEDLLKKEGIFPFTIHIGHDTRNNVTITETDDFRQTRFNQMGPVISEDEYQTILDMIHQVGDNADTIVLSGSLPPHMKDNAYEDIINLLKSVKPSLRIILDTDNEALLCGLKAKPYMVKPNVHEAERLLNRKIVTLDDQKQALIDIHNLGAEIVVMSRGGNGIIGYNGIQIFEVAAVQVDVKSTVGAGDALVAGMCYALEKNQSFAEMLEFGVLTSAAKVITPGTGTCGWDEINLIQERPKVREV